jgi:hypothetical protein
LFRRSRFHELIERQLALFVEDNAALIVDVEEADRAQREAPAGEAEARYETYADLVETGTEILAELRDTFASTLDDDARAAYEREFNRAVVRRLPRFALEIDSL